MFPSLPRLVLERLTAATVSELLALARADHVKRFLLDGHTVSEEWASDELRRSDALFTARGIGLFLVRPRDRAADFSALGFAGFRVYEDFGPRPQLLYALAERHTGQGFATELARGLVEWARSLGVDPITSAADAPNTASIRVLEKAGFVPRGRVPGAFGDIVLFERFAPDPPPALRPPAGCVIPCTIDRTWDGLAVDASERVALTIEARETDLVVRVDAPYHGDPPPTAIAGPTSRLWEHEVVELMLLGDDERYLEVELSPHGHYLVLELAGARAIVAEGLHVFFSATRSTDRWQGLAFIPRAYLPPGLSRFNAFAVHGRDASRRYLALSPASNCPRPDFHRLDAFLPLPFVSTAR